MSDKKSTAPNRKLLTPTEPFKLVLRQTAGRDNVAIFSGKDCEKAALAYKDEILGVGGVAFILKPERVFVAPEKPVATEINLGGSDE